MEPEKTQGFPNTSKVRRLLLVCCLAGPAPALAQMISRPRSPAPDPSAFSSPTTDVAGVLALFKGRAPLGYTVVRSYPHDPSAFTEGLIWYDGLLYESTGLQGESAVRKLDLNTGVVLGSVASPDRAFGEGLARVGNRLIQLTYKEGRALVYDVSTLKPIDEFQYSGEGWGLAFDGESLIMSDGSSTLTFRDPATFQPRRQIQVTAGGKPLAAINELEFANGKIWANIWLSDIIVQIDPASGNVTGYLDLAGLMGPGSGRTDENDVLNGIAYNPTTGHLFVTGKRWPALFELKLDR